MKIQKKTVIRYSENYFEIQEKIYIYREKAIIFNPNITAVK